MTVLNDDVITRLSSLSVALLLDSGSLTFLNEHLRYSLFKGVTTNPSLLKSAGSYHYETFLQSLLLSASGRSISFGTTRDDLDGMIAQARKLHAMSNEIYIKIPIVNARGESTLYAIETLLNDNIKVNITAIMTKAQIDTVLSILHPEMIAYLSIFAGRIADTGRCPKQLFQYLKRALYNFPEVKTLWASVREVYNIFDANDAGADLITLNEAIIKKLPMIGMNLEKLSQETVAMFHQAAKEGNVVEIA